MTQGDLDSMFRSLKKAVIERAMSAEMSDHLGYRHGESKPEGQGNQRNGTTGKTVITDDGPVRIEVPRDRDGAFEPQIIGKHERRFTGFDQKIIICRRTAGCARLDGASPVRLAAAVQGRSRRARCASVQPAALKACWMSWVKRSRSSTGFSCTRTWMRLARAAYGARCKVCTRWG